MSPRSDRRAGVDPDDGARLRAGTGCRFAHLRSLRDAKDADGFSRAVWKEMAGLGLAGMIVPEALGGAGLGFAELGLVLEECGRTLAPTPLVSYCRAERIDAAPRGK